VRAGVRAGRQFGSGVIRDGGRAGARDSRSERCGGQRACVRAVAVAAGAVYNTFLIVSTDLCLKK
jgi:hypothetical protein